MQLLDKPRPTIDTEWRIVYAWFPVRLADRWVWLERFERRFIGTWPSEGHWADHYEDRLIGQPDTVKTKAAFFSYRPIAD